MVRQGGRDCAAAISRIMRNAWSSIRHLSKARRSVSSNPGHAPHGPPSNKALYRVLARQPLSIELQAAGSLDDLSIQGTSCRLAISPEFNDKASQREKGGTILAIEFERDIEEDMIVVAREGFELIEDFLAAITVVTGSPFGPSVLSQVAKLTDDEERNCEFIQFLPLPWKQWHEPISKPTIALAKHLLAHWDGLENGHRLRRGARYYRDAAGNPDDVAAFQDAYIGLETLEPPLAKAFGLTPGTEEFKGKCAECGAEFVRKKTTLVGVRAFVLESFDPKTAHDGRSTDWKLMNGLRNDLMHGLVDEKSLADRPYQSFIATMHHLHNAIAVLSHANELVREHYRLPRGGKLYVLAGAYSVKEWPPLNTWRDIVETSEFRWVPHNKHGFVPEISFRNSIENLALGIAFLDGPLSFATMQDLRNSSVETGLR
jgi:hypothetical protein